MLATDIKLAVESPRELLAKTQLYDLHCALGARMVPFAGYSMPVQYPTGIINEHLHTRQHAGLFDISHMGQVLIEGFAAAEILERLVPADLVSLEAGKMRYTQMLDHGGHILDDAVFARLAPADPLDNDNSKGQGPRAERFFLVVNASTKSSDLAHLTQHAGGLSLSMLQDRSLLSLQGPRAEEILARRLPEARSLSFMTMTGTRLEGIELFISRSGYTGEDGFEISIPSAAVEGFARDLLAEKDVWPIGLGARDSLRLEAGLCLYGHDIDQTTNPVEAALSWSIPKRRREDGGFPGEALILKMLKEGPERRRVGFILDGKAPAREGAEIITLDGEKIGRVTSGGFSPTLSKPIAMGYVETKYSAPGTEVFIVVRGKPLKAKATVLPFVPHNYKRGM